MKQISRGGRRAKRAGPLDAFLSSGARSAPELRPASGSLGLDSRPKTKKNLTNIENMFRRSRRAKRAGVLDAFLSSGARSAPELK